MRILVLVNFYPPHDLGGYEQRCCEVVRGLVERGHDVHVLTSRYGLGRNRRPEANVNRCLHLESDLFAYRPLRFFTTRRREERENLASLRRRIGENDPEIIYVWGMWNLPRSLACEAERLRPGRVVYAFEGDWPYRSSIHEEYWRASTRRAVTRPMKSVLRLVALGLLRLEGYPPSLRFEYSHAVSHSLHEQLMRAGVPLKDFRVIYGGIDVDASTAHASRRSFNASSLRLLYAGRLEHDKGVHTAIKAVRLLALQHCPVTLTIVGRGHPEYETSLHELVRENGLVEYVRFRPQVPKEEMPALLAEFDVLVFPSHREALPRIVAEAMSSGMIVVGTRVGGTADLLMPEVTGLSFEPEDAAMLASHVKRLIGDVSLRERLSAGGRAWVQKYFALDRMIDEIEAYLKKVARN